MYFLPCYLNLMGSYLYYENRESTFFKIFKKGIITVYNTIMYGGKCYTGFFIRDICADHDKVFASNLVQINFLIINITNKMLINFKTFLWNFIFILVDY